MSARQNLVTPLGTWHPVARGSAPNDASAMVSLKMEAAPSTHGMLHCAWAQLDAQRSSAQGAHGSWQSLVHLEWLHRTSQGAGQGGHGALPWHCFWQLWGQVVYLRPQTWVQAPWFTVTAPDRVLTRHL